MENTGNNQVGPHVAVAVADVQWLVTMMFVRQSFVVEGVGNVTRRAGPEKITPLTTRGAIKTSNTLNGLSPMKGEFGL